MGGTYNIYEERRLIYTKYYIKYSREETTAEIFGVDGRKVL
jgi:hypothetical protein